MRVLLSILLILCLGITQVTAQYKENGRNKIVEFDSCITKGRTKDFLKEGTWKTYYPDGKLKSIGKFHLSNPQGQHVSYHHNGKTSRVVNYDNGKYEGPWLEFNENGDTTLCMNFVQGGQHGPYVHKSNDQLVVIRGQYDHGKMTGLWVTKNEIGIIDSINYVSGKKNGRALHYYNYKLYSVRYFKDDKLDSTYSIFDERGHLKQQQKYKNGVLLFDATYYTNDVLRVASYYDEDGSRKMVHRNFINGSPQHIDWYGRDEQLDSTHEYKNGVLDRRIIYRRGIRNTAVQSAMYDYNCGRLFWIEYDNISGHDSVHYKYYEDGSIKSRLSFRNGAAHGRYAVYYPNGKTKLTAWMNSYSDFDSLRVYTEEGILLYGGAHREMIIGETDMDEHYVSFQPEERGVPLDDDDWQPEINSSEPQPDTAVHIVADIYPQFPGDTLQQFIRKNLRYPQPVIDVEGTVYVRFIVEKNGAISSIEIAKEIHGHPEYSDEAIRVVKNMPNWIPGQVNGQQARIMTVIPVPFRID